MTRSNKFIISILILLVFLTPLFHLFTVQASISAKNSNLIDVVDYKDSYVDANNPNSNYGTYGTLWLGNNGNYKTYIQFDLSSVSNASAVSFEFLNYGDASGLTNINAYVVTSSWDENLITYNNQPTHDSTVYEQFSITTYGNSLIDFTNITNVWLSHQKTNYGMMLESTQPLSLDIYSREGASNAAGDSPTLVISPQLASSNTVTNANSASQTNTGQTNSNIGGQSTITKTLSDQNNLLNYLALGVMAMFLGGGGVLVYIIRTYDLTKKSPKNHSNKQSEHDISSNTSSRTTENKSLATNELPDALIDSYDINTKLTTQEITLVKDFLTSIKPNIQITLPQLHERLKISIPKLEYIIFYLLYKEPQFGEYIPDIETFIRKDVSINISNDEFSNFLKELELKKQTRDNK